ncbi:MAG: phosphoribosylglycinamide formyltransferase [Caulobacteraceae bacterium]
MISLGFLASNNGTSLRAIIWAIESGALAAEARLVVSNRAAAPALVFAREHSIPTRVIATAANAEFADVALARALRDAGVELVVLSGYLRRIGPRTLRAYQNRILNIHPALLPEFGGEGMYGRRVHEAVVAAGAARTGASVHLVDGQYDHGAVLARVEFPVLPGDTPESIERRVMAVEPKLFIETLQRIAAGSLRLPGS